MKTIISSLVAAVAVAWPDRPQDLVKPAVTGPAFFTGNEYGKIRSNWDSFLTRYDDNTTKDTARGPTKVTFTDYLKGQSSVDFTPSNNYAQFLVPTNNRCLEVTAGNGEKINSCVW